MSTILLRAAACCKHTHDTRWVGIVFINERSGVSRVRLSVDKSNGRNSKEGR